MPEWLYEVGIGENRAALIDGGRIVEMAIERDTDTTDMGPRAGAILPARIVQRADASGRGLVELDSGGIARIAGGFPASESARLLVELVREAIPEGREIKPAQVRAAAAGAVERPGATLRERLDGAVRTIAPGDGALDAAGWADAVEEAASGIVARPEAMLRIALTPAMTLIDVDGTSAPAELAVAGARLAGEAIRRFGIAGSIGIDLPSLPDKAGRQAAAGALDAALPPPFERTAVNGFGFLQIVRRRVRASLPERLAADPVAAAALALLRAGERAAGHGGLTLEAHPAVIARLAARPDWIDALARRTGAPVGLSGAAGLPISAGHAVRRQS